MPLFLVLLLPRTMLPHQEGLAQEEEEGLGNAKEGDQTLGRGYTSDEALEIQLQLKPSYQVCP